MLEIAYHHFVEVSAVICSRTGGRVRSMLAIESVASKHEKTTVFWSEFGCATLTTWKSILKEFPPWSPPILIQTSSSGMIPLCHVRAP